jgi:hypothetical protein
MPELVNLCQLLVLVYLQVIKRMFNAYCHIYQFDVTHHNIDQKATLQCSILLKLSLSPL